MKRKGPGSEMISAEKAEELKMKEKRRREREVASDLYILVKSIQPVLLI